MISKRGQVTIFVIISIVILFTIAGFLFMKGSFEKGEIELKEEKMIESVQLGGNVQNYIEGCIEKIGEDAVHFIGERGGYYDLPEVYNQNFSLPYYFYENKNLTPSKKIVEKELAKYMDEMLFFCVEKFEYFKDKGYEIEEGKIQTEVKILDSKVKFRVNFPVYVAKGSTGKELLLFETDVKSRLKTILEVNEQLVGGIVQKPFAINLGQISDLSLDNDLMIEMSDLKNDVYFLIVDKHTLNDEEIYDFNFVVEYRFGEDEQDNSTFPEIDDAPLFEEDEDIFEE